jgi:PBP1b-binding outer membrane lipoprotein LpoB
MGGVITSTIQEVGREKVIYYKATFELTDIATTEILWTDHKEISKNFKKRSVGF